MAELAQFHFLRPAWLLLLIPAAFAVWLMLRGQRNTHVWRGVVAPHLLPHLLVRHGEQSRGLRPTWILGLVWLLAVLALAGPAWQRQSSPFSQDEAALVIAIKVAPEMLARDVQPSRLERAVHKVRDLLAARPGARSALVAYAGSAHLVMPLTSDASIIETFAAELTPDIMPVPGDAAAEAVVLGNRLLKQAGLAGSIVLVADSVERSQLAGLEAARAEGGAEVHILAMAAGPEVIPPSDSPPAPALDRDAMAAASRAAGGSLRLVTVDDADVRVLARDVATSLARAPAQDGQRWRDDGYFLVPFIGFLLLFLFRRGGAVALD